MLRIEPEEFGDMELLKLKLHNQIDAITRRVQTIRNVYEIKSLFELLSSFGHIIKKVH
jgi:hypothetical protein